MYQLLDICLCMSDEWREKWHKFSENLDERSNRTETEVNEMRGKEADEIILTFNS